MKFEALPFWGFDSGHHEHWQFMFTGTGDPKRCCDMVSLGCVRLAVLTKGPGFQQYKLSLGFGKRPRRLRFPSCRSSVS